MSEIMGEILSVDNVNAKYGSAHILQGVSFTLENKVIAIVGRNGMGKTTLVKTIMGLVPVTSGKILLWEKEITNKKPYQIASFGVGYVPQGRELFPSLTVNEHFQLVSRSNKDKVWNKERIYSLFPNLGRQPNKPAMLLSGGEQQMVAIGRALLTNPSLLIMDEPSEGLAPIMIESLIKTCRTLMSSGISILLVEQNIHVATSLAEELYIMSSGRIIQKIDSNTIMQSADIRENMLGV